MGRNFKIKDVVQALETTAFIDNTTHYIDEYFTVSEQDISYFNANKEKYILIKPYNAPTYQCIRVVSALKITNIVAIDSDKNELFFESEYGSVIVTTDWIVHNKPIVGGYYIVWDNNHVSYSSSVTFELNYIRN